MGAGAHLDPLVRTLPVGVVALDRRGRIREVNPALGELTGFDRAELIDAEMAEVLVPRGDAPRTRSFLAEVERLGKAEVELNVARKDASQFAALVGGRHSPDAGLVLSFCDVSQFRRREARLAELAAKDELTGLLNKRSFLVRLAGEVARGRRNERPLSLALLDLDGFKAVNDTAGHPAGDRVLAEAAGRLGALVRSGEHLARVGGDEFGWILADADADGASSAVARARHAIGAELFRGAGNLTLSAGICVSRGSLDAGEVYHRADRALYRAKSEGGDRMVVLD